MKYLNKHKVNSILLKCDNADISVQDKIRKSYNKIWNYSKKQQLVMLNCNC